MAIKRTLPKVETGYELGADRYGYFSIIQPESRTINYIKNPVFFTNDPHSSYKARGTAVTPCDYGYSYVNATGAPKDRPLSIYGAGAKITPTDPTLESCTIYYPITLAAGTYTASLYYSAGADHEFALQVTNTTRTVQYGETATNYGSGLNGFQRIYVTFTISAQTNLYIRFTEFADSLGRLSPFYTDMWQCENKPYMTQHFIGQSQFYTHDRNPGAYDWWGVPFFSESVRTDKAYESGKIIDLSDLGFRLTGIAGLGANPMNTVISPIASGGGIFEGTTDASRTFTLIGRFYGMDLQDVLTKRRNLYELIRPNGRNIYDQPTTLMFRIWDCAKKSWVGQPITIFCRYVSGLEGAIDSETSEDITITFTCEDPYVYSAYEKSYDMDLISPYEQLEADTNHVSPIFILRDNDGIWKRLEIRLDNPTGSGRHSDLCVVENILPDGAGGYYIYGAFNTVVYKGQTTTVNQIFRYNRAADSISALGGTTKGVADGEIHRVITTPNWDAFAVGSFTSAGGVANTNCIAKYKPSTNTWHSVSSGITQFAGKGPEIFDIEYNDDDMIYVSGIFESIGGLGVLPIEGIARMQVRNDVWSMLPIARTMYVYPPEGNRIIRLFTSKREASYPNTDTARGFISGSLMTFDTPFTSGIVAWDGTETFYTNWQADGNYGGGEYPANFLNPVFRGVIRQDTRQFYCVTGNDRNIYQLEFVMPAHTKENWAYNPGDPYPRFDTVYTFKDRDSPSRWKRLNPPFSRDVRIDFGSTLPDWQVVPLSMLRHSELKISNNRLLISPNFSYGFDAYEVDGMTAVPENELVAILWQLPLWKGSSAQFTPLDIFASNYAYSAAFDINFGTLEGMVAVNPGHISPQKAGDNEISVTIPAMKVVINNGESTPMYFRVTGPASLSTFANQTTEQTIRMDGYFVPQYGEANVIALPAHGSKLGDWMHGHLLDSSDVDIRLVPGKNIVYCKLDDADEETAVKVIFRERYASIEKAIEYVGG